MRHHWVLVVLTILFLVILVSVAVAGPVERGSLAAAEEHWGAKPCDVRVLYAPLPGRLIGLATWPDCTITLDSPRRRPWAQMPLKMCLITTHEWEHLIQAAENNGAMWHSTDPEDVMYRFFGYHRDTPECRARWPHRP